MIFSAADSRFTMLDPTMAAVEAATIFFRASLREFSIKSSLEELEIVVWAGNVKNFSARKEIRGPNVQNRDRMQGIYGSR
jgi:hypothetical protein